MTGTGQPPNGMTRPGGEGEMSPQEALALVEKQRHEVAGRLMVDIELILGAWGVAWLVGFGAAYLSYGRHATVPGWLATVLLTVVNLGAAALTFGQSARRGAGIEGPSREVMSMYMWAWPLALAGVFAVDSALARDGLPVRLDSLLWSGTAACTVGVLYLAGGMLFRDRVHYGLGIWMLITGAASVFAGPPGNFAVLALAGGGGFLVAAGWYAWAGRRPAR
ncbi:MAG TPA: hypothetical protein VKS82_24280 [Streptosporangiaceae bacterium]|nr:hypothetical protein [Streptosporangiaceae bacterium]